MWEAVQLDPETENFSQICSGEDLDSCRASAGNKTAKKDKVFYFWAGEIPDDENETIKIFNQVKDANDGLISIMTIGADFTSVERTTASCSGRCFCVITSGSRRCETQYCNDYGYCWWVPCGQSC